MNNQGYIDVNVSLGHWPFHRFDFYTPARLDEHLSQEGIDQAWVSAIDSVLYPDPDLYDRALFQKLKKYPNLKPVKTVDPTLPTWQDDLEDAVSKWSVHAIKLYPNYHRYSLEDGRVGEVMAYCRGRGLMVLIAIRLEDERNQHPLMPVPQVPAEQIGQLASRHPEVPVIGLCALNGEIAGLMEAGADNVYLDLSMLDGADMMEKVLTQVNSSRLLFGSHSPFLYTRPAAYKMTFHDISPEDQRRIGRDNASGLHPDAQANTPASMR